MKKDLLLLILAATVAASCQTAAAPPPTPTPFVGHMRVVLDDITMYVAAQGEGAPLLLLHGGFANADVWSNQVPSFAREYYVITPDSRGQGRTTDSEAPISYRRMAEDTLRLMDYLGIDSAYIVGWSDGGIIGLDLAINHPERVKALVAYGANTSPDQIDEATRAYVRDTPVAQFQKNLPAEVTRLAAQPERLPIIIDKVRTMWLTEPNFTAAELAGIKTPTLILEGVDSDLEIARSIAQSIPGAELVILPGTGHFALFEKPAAFNEAVLAFLKDK